DLDRAESTQAGVQRDLGKTNAFYLKAFDQFLAEVETRRGGGYSAFMFGIYGLVTFLIFLIRLAFDVFGQGSLTQYFQYLAELVIAAIPQETDSPSPAGGIVDHLCYQVAIIAEIQLISDPDLSGRINDHIPQTIGLVQLTEQKSFYPRSRL